MGIVKCSKCGKLYDYDKYDGICPKCARYNKETSAAEDHQEYHNQYDGGYDHSASDSHYSFHERYDGAEEPHAHYRQTPAEHSAQLEGVQETLREVMGAEHKVNLEVKPAGKVKVDKKAAIILGIIFAVFFLNILIPLFGPLIIVIGIAAAIKFMNRKNKKR